MVINKIIGLTTCESTKDMKSIVSHSSRYNREFSRGEIIIHNSNKTYRGIFRFYGFTMISDETLDDSIVILRKSATKTMGHKRTKKFNSIVGLFENDDN